MNIFQLVYWKLIDWKVGQNKTQIIPAILQIIMTREGFMPTVRCCNVIIVAHIPALYVMTMPCLQWKSLLTAWISLKISSNSSGTTRSCKCVKTCWSLAGKTFTALDLHLTSVILIQCLMSLFQLKLPQQEIILSPQNYSMLSMA